MTHFPLFLNLKNRKILIFGGGNFALERINKLMPFSASLTVISPHISDEIKAIKEIEYCERAFEPRDLDCSPAFVITAEDRETTAGIYAQCNMRNIPVNAVDMPEYCDIIFPCVISTEHLCIGISSGGISPTATVEFKERFAKQIPDNIDEILVRMPSVRQYIKQNAPAQHYKALLRKVFVQALDENRIPDEKEISVLIRALTDI